MTDEDFKSIRSDIATTAHLLAQLAGGLNELSKRVEELESRVINTPVMSDSK